MSEPALLPLAESVADGSSVDWHAAEAKATVDEQAVIRQLRVLASLAAIHRSIPDVPGPASPAADRPPSAAPAIGSWAHLSLVERLGGGTFGEVYRAWDRHLEREVALKLLRLEDASDDPQSSRIAREGRLLARVHHPNVITVHGVEVHEGRVGLCMELVRGITLEDVLQKNGPFGAREACVIGIDLCRALAAVHGAGLIHRDIKAQNVMREDRGRIVLMDLGTGRDMRPDPSLMLSDLAGTPLYLAPEIFTGASASARTDLYSLGVLLYHLVTGSFPVPAKTVDDLREAQERGNIVRLRDVRADLPSMFVQVVERAIARDPERRYGSAGALEADLLDALRATAGIRPLKAPEPAAPLPKESWYTPVLPAIALGLVSAVVLSVVVWRLIWAPTRAALPADPAPGRVSLLAVLPFDNLSADNDEAYLANAVPMELTAKLGQIGTLKVVPWTFMRRFAGPGHSLKEVAERTGADAVIEGSVQRAPGAAGSRRAVQIRVQLFQPSSGNLLWSASFERDIGDFFVVQAQIAREVAARVRGALAARDETLVSQSRTVPADVMEDYLNARHLLEVQMNLQGAIEVFNRIVQKAPNFAEAYVGLASCYSLQSAYFGAVPSQAALRRALDASNRAIELDATIPEAWSERAFARFTLERNWEAAEADFGRAMAIGPNVVGVLESYSNYLTIRGRHADAIAAARRAEARAPMSAAASRQVAYALYMAHQYDNAIEQVRHIFEIEPGYAPARTVLGRARLHKGAFAEALQELEAIAREYPHHLALGYAMAGRRGDAERVLNEMLSPTSGRPIVPYQVALVHASLGNTAQALDWLEQADRAKDPALIQMGVDPSLDRLHGEPRFQRLLTSLNLQH